MATKKEIATAISVLAYATRIGLRESTVRYAIKQGHIQRGLWRGGNGRLKIIPEIADKEWGKRPATPDPEIPQDADKQAVAATKAKQMQEVLKAEKLRLEVEEKKGKLIDKQQAYRAMFAMGVEIRTALLGIPDRVVDDMLASKTRHEAHKVLYDAIEAELSKLSSTLERDISK